MLENIKTFIQMVIADWQNFLLGGIVIVSAIIVAIGMLKPLIASKITNKRAKKAILAALDVVFSFAGTAIQFWVTEMPFEHYVVASIMHLFATIVVYWLYENTSFRDAIHFIGSTTLNKVGYVALSNFVKKNETPEQKLNSIKSELAQNTLPELKNKAHKEISSADFSAIAYKPDNELKNL